MRARKRLGGALTALLIVASLVSGVIDAVTATAASTCADWLFIGARGSGAPYNDGHEGMGSENFSIYQYAASQVDGSKRYKGLFYPAISLNWSEFGALAGAYQNSVTSGVINLINDVRSEVDNCPYQRIALMGYSSGADAIGDTMNMLRDDSYLRQHIAAISLLGDPDFNPGSTSNAGNFSNTSWGIATQLGGVFPRVVPWEFLGSTISWCDKYDYVCNWSASSFRDHQPSCHCGHFNYVGGNMTRDIGNWIAAKLRSLPPMTYVPPVNPTYPTFAYHVNSGVNVRPGPDTSNAPLTYLNGGSAVQILCQTHGSRLYADTDIWDRTTVGWVYDHYVDTPVNGDFSPNLPRCTATSPPYWVRHVNGNYNPLSVRSAPNISASVVGSLATGSEIRVICTVYGGWVGDGNGGRLWAYTNDGRWVTALGVDVPNGRETSWPIPQC